MLKQAAGTFALSDGVLQQEEGDVMQIVFTVIYMLLGVLLSIPYYMLAGGFEESFLIVVYVAPAFLFIWCALAVISGVMERGNGRVFRINWRAAFGKTDRRVLPWSLTIFWIWTVYCTLPVILHWAAVILGRIGYQPVASVIDTYRYASLFYVFVTTLALLFFIGVASSAWGSVRNIWARFMQR